jgi:hypothetical protein
LRGYPVMVLPGSGFDHWIGNSLGGGKIIQNSLITTYRRRALSERNKSFVLLICSPAPAFYPLLPLHLLLLTAEGMILSLLKGSWRVFSEIYFSCLRSIWGKRACLFRVRRSIQSSRRVSSGKYFAAYRWFPYKLEMLAKHGIPSIR